MNRLKVLTGPHDSRADYHLVHAGYAADPAGLVFGR